jgi:hypothetical protein
MEEFDQRVKTALLKVPEQDREQATKWIGHFFRHKSELWGLPTVLGSFIIMDEHIAQYVNKEVLAEIFHAKKLIVAQCMEKELKGWYDARFIYDVDPILDRLIAERKAHIDRIVEIDKEISEIKRMYSYEKI